MDSRPVYGSDVIVDLLGALNIDYVACNPGATFRGLHDSLVNYRHDIPLIECPHEEISVAIAHGYAKATGRVMAAALHDVVGLQHASMAIYNAWCDRAPVLLLGGTGPVDASRRRPWIDWIHAANLQADQVRHYTKWDDQPASLHAVPESLTRAWQISMTSPRGPVYVCLDSDVQEQEIPAGFDYVAPREYAHPGLIAPDESSIATILDWLLAASFPAIAIESVDGLAQASDDLAFIATTLGAAVVEPARDYGRPALCLPTAHPLNLTGAWGDLPRADAVLMIEVRDLEAVALPVAADALIAQVGTAVLGARAWAADLQRLQRADLVVLASPAPVLAALRRGLEKSLAPGPSHAKRGNRIADRVRQARVSWETEARSAKEDDTIDQAVLAVSVWDAVREQDPVLANGSLSDWAHRTWDLKTPDSYLGSSGGAGLGYGLGASIGAALAHRDDDRLVVDLQSDGDLLMTPAALWTAAHESLPLLIVMDNNRAYQNSVHHARLIATTRGRDTSRAHIGTTLTDPEIDFAAMAESMGVRSFGPVSRGSELPAILREAVSFVMTERRPALVDVRTEVRPGG
ncbi:MAG TPA: thiamine pyrophosphate-dependent enzyme [Propionibacteriaceae bacterium]